MRVRISWGLPIDDKVEKEVGRVMIAILPLIESIEADSEGAIVKLIDFVGTEELEELKKTLKYVKLEIEESSPEE